MRNANQVITLYNYFWNPDADRDECKRTLISGASVFAQTQVNVGKEGVSAASVYTIRIPECSVKETYVSPKQFQNLDGKDGFFTLGKGDKIVLGSAPEEAPTQGELESIYGGDQVMTITGVTDNRGKRESHWKVTGQ